MENLLKIKEFATLTGLSVRTLHYYDSLELLIPEKKTANGHRYYGSQNFSTIFLINSLKELGMSLIEIKDYLTQPKQQIEDFILTEKQQLEQELTRLKLKLNKLSSLEKFLGSPLMSELNRLHLTRQKK